MIDRGHDLTLTRQAELLRLSRSTLYYEPRPVLVAATAESRSQVFGLARLLGDDQAPHRSPLFIRQVSPR